MDQPLQHDHAVEKIVDAFRLMGELLGYAIAHRLAAEAQGAAVNAPVVRGPLLMNLKQAADYMGMGKSSLSVLISEGKIPRVFVGGRPKFRACDLDEYVRSQITGAGEIGKKRGKTVVEVGRQPSKRKRAADTKVPQKGAKRKPNEADRYAARAYGLNLRALKITASLLQEVLKIDSKQYTSWAYEGGDLPPEAREKFDTWCAGYVQSIRQMYPDGGGGYLIDPSTSLE